MYFYIYTLNWIEKKSQIYYWKILLQDITLKGFWLQEWKLDQTKYREWIDYLLDLVRAGKLKYEYVLSLLLYSGDKISIWKRNLFKSGLVNLLNRRIPSIKIFRRYTHLKLTHEKSCQNIFLSNMLCIIIMNKKITFISYLNIIATTNGLKLNKIWTKLWPIFYPNLSRSLYF